MFKDDVKHYLKAGFPALYVETHEEARAEAELKAVAKDAKRKFLWWTVTNGWQSEETSLNKNVTAPIAALNAVTTLPEEVILVLRDFHPFMRSEAADIVRKVRDLIPVLKATGRLLVFLSPEVRIPLELQKEITLVPFTLPTRDELSKILDTVVEATGGKAKVEDRVALLEAARGLTVSEAENAFALAAVKHSGFPFVSVKTVRDEKANTIKKTGLVTWKEPQISIDGVGGLANLKADLAKIAPIFHHPDKAEAYGFLPEDFPRSIALVGVPGTGKSMVAEAIPALLRVGCVQTDFGRIFGPKVGESEGNILRRNQLVESMAPVVDIWDEAEKGLAGVKGSDQNPWEARIGGTILTWFEEFRARVLVVATINRQAALPPEMWNRFQRVYFVDLPTVDECVEILNIHLGKRSIKLGTQIIQALAAEAGQKGMNGREIRNAVQAAMQTAFADGKQVTETHIQSSLRDITPLSVSRSDEIAALREWADKNNIRRAGAAVTQPDVKVRRVAVPPKEGK